MKMIVGLGNPGKEYEKTRHNAGFWVVDSLADKFGVTTWKDQYNASISEFRLGGEKILLVKPQTYMNLSGEAVQPLMHFYKLELDDLLVIYDDLDLPTGTVRIRKNGSSGGQKGMTSIIQRLNEDDFPRIRMGIGRPPAGWTVANYVTSQPTEEEEVEKFKVAVSFAMQGVELFITDGIQKAMNEVHRKEKKKNEEKTSQEE